MYTCFWLHFVLKLKLTFVPLDPKGYWGRKVHPRRGSSLVLRWLCPSWDDPGRHPSPLPRVLPVWHRGLLWLEPAGQGGEAGQLAEGRDVRTRHYRGRMILGLSTIVMHAQMDPVERMCDFKVDRLPQHCSAGFQAAACCKHSSWETYLQARKASQSMFLVSSLCIHSLLHKHSQTLDILSLRRHLCRFV